MKKLIFPALFLFCGVVLISCVDDNYEELKTEEATSGEPSRGGEEKQGPA